MPDRPQEVQQELLQLIRKVQQITQEQEVSLARIGELVEELKVDVQPTFNPAERDPFLEDPLWMGRIQP